MIIIMVCVRFYQINADLLESDVSVIVKCHPSVAVVAVYHCHPVWLVTLKTISLVLLATPLMNQE